MVDFLKDAFKDMKESAKAQHKVDKANMDAVKAESKAMGRSKSYVRSRKTQGNSAGKAQ